MEFDTLFFIFLCCAYPILDALGFGRFLSAASIVICFFLYGISSGENSRLLWTGLSDEERSEVLATLIRAMNISDLETLEHTLLRNPFLLNNPMSAENGRTLMHCAASYGNAEVVRLLVRLGSTAMNVKDIYGRLPIHDAAYYGYLETVECLVKADRSTLDATTSMGLTSMHCGAGAENASELVELLYRLGSNAMTMISYDGSTPLTYAISDDKAVRKLIQLGSPFEENPGYPGRSPLRLACSMPFPCSERTLHAVGADVSNLSGFTQRIIRYISETNTEERILEQRHRIYFSRSLVERLTLELDREKNIRKIREEVETKKFFLE